MIILINNHYFYDYCYDIIRKSVTRNTLRTLCRTFKDTFSNWADLLSNHSLVICHGNFLILIIAVCCLAFVWKSNKSYLNNDPLTFQLFTRIQFRPFIWWRGRRARREKEPIESYSIYKSIFSYFRIFISGLVCIGNEKGCWKLGMTNITKQLESQIAFYCSSSSSFSYYCNALYFDSILLGSFSILWLLLFFRHCFYFTDLILSIRCFPCNVYFKFFSFN